MTTRNILCPYNGGSSSIGSLRYAIKIARHHDGWLTGIVRHGRPELETRFGSQLPRDVIDTMHDNDMVRIKEISEVFASEVAAAGLTERAEFLEIEDEDDLILGDFARSFDMVVTGVPKREMAATHLAAHPDLIALRSGRPVLIVPDAYEREGMAGHALVAWDGKRSAARALGDAMSILEDKAKVSILCVGKRSPEGIDRLLVNLERHGINVELITRPKVHSVGQTVLETTRDIGAQLIVMGAYEHSKFSHDLLGGVTTDVISKAHVPLFMSH